MESIYIKVSLKEFEEALNRLDDEYDVELEDMLRVTDVLHGTGGYLAKLVKELSPVKLFDNRVPAVYYLHLKAGIYLLHHITKHPETE
jgi:hypothetical protein